MGAGAVEKEKMYFVFLSSDKRGTVMVGLLFLGHNINL